MSASPPPAASSEEAASEVTSSVGVSQSIRDIQGRFLKNQQQTHYQGSLKKVGGGAAKIRSFKRSTSRENGQSRRPAYKNNGECTSKGLNIKGPSVPVSKESSIN